MEIIDTISALILGIWEDHSSLFTRYTSTAAHTGAVNTLIRCNIRLLDDDD